MFFVFLSTYHSDCPTLYAVHFVCRCIYLVPHSEHFWGRNWRRRVSEVPGSTRCSFATGSQTPLLSNRPNQPKCECTMEVRVYYTGVYYQPSFMWVLLIWNFALLPHVCPCLTSSQNLVLAYLGSFFPLTFACRYWAMPAFWLKRQIMLNLPSDNLEYNVANSVDFMVERVSWKTFERKMQMECFLQLDLLDRGQLASRLTLNCTDSYIEPQKLKDVYVTIMDVRMIAV